MIGKDMNSSPGESEKSEKTVQNALKRLSSPLTSESPSCTPDRLNNYKEISREIVSPSLNRSSSKQASSSKHRESPAKKSSGSVKPTSVKSRDAVSIENKMNKIHKSTGEKHKNDALDSNEQQGRTTQQSPRSPKFQPDSKISPMETLSQLERSYLGYYLPFSCGYGQMVPEALASHWARLAALNVANNCGEKTLSPRLLSKYSGVRLGCNSSTGIPGCIDPMCLHCQQNGGHLNRYGLALNNEQFLVAPPKDINPLYAKSLQYPHCNSVSQKTLGSNSSDTRLLPFTCSWNNGSGFCSKQFYSSDELLLHLRGHVTKTDEDGLIREFPSNVSPLGLNGGIGGFNGFIPSLLGFSPLHLPSVYPRSSSPTPSLENSRYHPYKYQPPMLQPSLNYQPDPLMTRRYLHQYSPLSFYQPGAGPIMAP